MNLIQWFVRLLKKDMAENEVKAEEQQKIYSAIKTKLKYENKMQKEEDKNELYRGSKPCQGR